MQGDELMSQDVLARGQRGRDRGAVSRAVRDHLVCAPGARVGAGHEAGLVDLEELKLGGFDVGELAVNAGEVAEGWAVVAFWPCVPLQFEGASSGDGGGDGAWFAAAVADYAWAVETVCGNETIVPDFRAPADCLWGVRVIRIDIADPAAMSNQFAISVRRIEMVVYVEGRFTYSLPSRKIFVICPWAETAGREARPARSRLVVMGRIPKVRYSFLKSD